MVEIPEGGFGGVHIFCKLESLQLVILLKIEIIQGYLLVVCHHKWRAGFHRVAHVTLCKTHVEQVGFI